jgi:hypothetical protein
VRVFVIREVGYEEAVLGFSLSYNTRIERVQEILPKYAFGVPGEGKFLEMMLIYLDVIAPRFWWQEADTYRVGTTKQSESTMHTLAKRDLVQEDFESHVPTSYLRYLNEYREGLVAKANGFSLAEFKNLLPEGFLQRRIWLINYKLLQNIYNQRYSHRLPQWRFFLDTVMERIEHPEFVVKTPS